MRYLYFFLCVNYFLCSTTISAMDLDFGFDLIYNKLDKAIKHGDAKKAYNLLDDIAALSSYDRKELFKLHDEDGNSLLHVLPAIGLSYDDAFLIFTKLVDMGHPLMVRNDQNQTPLHRAVNIGCVKTSLFIIKHSPMLLDRVDNKGQFPIHIAANNLNEVMLKVLLDAGSAMQLFAQDWHENTPVSHLVGNLKYYRNNYPRGLCSLQFNKSIFNLLITYMDKSGLVMLKEMLDEEKQYVSKKRESIYNLVENSVDIKLKRQGTTLVNPRESKRTRQ